MKRPKHLNYIRSLPCLRCGRRRQSEAHHLLEIDESFLDKPELPFGKKKGGRGTGMKPDDKFTIPLCPACHREVHAAGRESKIGLFSLEPIALKLFEKGKNV